MSGWENVNFASQHRVADNISSTMIAPVMQPPPLPPPVFTLPPANIPPPPLPPPALQMGFPYPPLQSSPIHPSCNISIPPPNILLCPPPIPGLQGSDICQINEGNSTEDKFEAFKGKLKRRYENIEVKPRIINKIKVSIIKQNMVKFSNLIRQLESHANSLQITHKSLPEDKWSQRCKEIENIRAELLELIATLDSPENLQEMLKTIKQRKKKIEYRKRKRKEWQEQKREAKLNSENENRRIDLWLEKMKDEVSRAKREEDIKREADMVLSDVTTKKTEAKRMLNLLNSLAKLRTARVQSLPAGQAGLDNGTDVFNKIIERLKKMWLDQIKGYNMEEQGLKVMLEHAEEERISVEVAEFRKNLKCWNKVIFGSSSGGSNLSQTVEEFIQIRYDWDKFIRTEDTILASGIPIGWVLPSKPSSEEWKKLL